MNFSIYVSILCVVAAALGFDDASGLNVDGYARSSDCRSSGAPLQGTFSLDPTGPNTVLVDIDASISEQLGAPLKAVVRIQRKVFWWWIPMPCVGDIGSCTYPDVCQYLPPAYNGPPGSCPPPLQELPSCQCPLRAGEYSVESDIDVPSIQIPSWLISGDYWVQVKLYKNSREVGCNEIYFSV